MVPGFSVNMDDFGVIGVAFRGIWGFEGKILLLVDGVEMNETLYGNIPLGNHYPVDQVKRIEIIRGPGSVLYGGFAEAAVIQVTTLQPEDLQGGAAGLAYGRGQQGGTRVQGNALYGQVGDRVSFSVAAYGGKADLSGQNYTDSTGRSYNMKGANTQDPTLVNLGVQAGDFRLRFITDQYQSMERDGSGVSLAQPLLQRFSNNALDVRYAWKLTEALTLNPYVVYRDQKPWWVEDPLLQQSTWMISTTRQKAGLRVAWAQGVWDLQCGGEYLVDKANIAPNNLPGYTTFLNGTSQVSYQDSGAFAQVQYLGEVNLTLGGRFEHHSVAGNAFVPRLALTKVFQLWHFKLLAAQSFRTPNIEPFQSPIPGSAIASERTTSYELEGGYQMGAGMLSVNLFDMKVSKPLVYARLAGGQEGYSNFPSIETRGVELQYQVRFNWGFLNGSYDYHTLDNRVGIWAVPGDDSKALGIPGQSGSIQVGIRLGHGWTLNPNLRYLGSRTAFVAAPAGPGLVLASRAADLVLGGTLVYTRGPWSGSLGLFDASNRNLPYLQPLAGGHAPMPGMGREVVAQLKFGF